MNNYLVDNRWIEIFLMVSSLLSEADEFFGVFRHSMNNIIEDEVCKNLLNWVERKAALSRLPPICSRGIIMYIIFSHFVHNFEDRSEIESKLLPQAQQLAHLLTFDYVVVALGYSPLHIRNRIHIFDSKFNLAFDLRLATEIGIDFNLHEFDRLTSMEPKQVEMFNQYLRADILFIDCLQLAWVSDSKMIGDRFLLPPQ